MIRAGLDVLTAQPVRVPGNARVGLLCNQASCNAEFRHARDLLHAALPQGLACLFSPQHGFFSVKQDNMIESGHMRDPFTGLPVYSLYGETREPTPEMLAEIDLLIVDLQDVGTRVYTYVWTMTLCMEAAARAGVRVMVLDRPNPLGGKAVEGNMPDPAWSSFVGLYPLPMRHGLTMGELAMYLNRIHGLGADLEVVPMGGWRRDMYFDATGLPWIFPSPNMPTLATALVYPGQVILEGTNLSEGRGTALPFELFGAPYVDPQALIREARPERLPGAVFRPLYFEPCSGKWAGRTCGGVQIHVTDARAFRPLRASMAFVQAAMRLYPGEFDYARPPYEYEYQRLPLDVIFGGPEPRKALEAGVDLLEIEALWQPDLEEFVERRQEVLLYR